MRKFKDVLPWIEHKKIIEGTDQAIPCRPIVDPSELGVT